jgi:predicted DNA binding CopG/RHH family protein
MHYNDVVFKAVRDSDWSAGHIAVHGVTLDDVREAILERPYWAVPGRDGTTLVYGCTYAGRYLLVGGHRRRRRGLYCHCPLHDRRGEEDLPQEGAMTMTKDTEQLPRSATELERLAGYYETHDTSAEMEHGEWLEPQPMATTSLRLPAEVIDQLKRQARARHVRYTSYVRSILERAARGGAPPEIAEITERLERIERAVTSRQAHDDQKTA